MDRENADDPELAAFLAKVDKVSSLVQGLGSGDAGAAADADAFIAKHTVAVDENGVEEIDGTRVTSSRTVINKVLPSVAQPQQGSHRGPPSDSAGGEQAAFMAGLAADAEARNERRRKGRIAAVEFKDRGCGSFPLHLFQGTACKCAASFPLILLLCGRIYNPACYHVSRSLCYCNICPSLTF